MAKSTRHSGASYTEHELSDPDAPQQIVIRRAMLGGDPKSVGGSSTPSGEKRVISSDNQMPQDHKPVQTTDNPSSQPPTDQDSDVNTTGGNGPETEKESSRKRSTTPRKKGKTVNLDEEF